MSYFKIDDWRKWSRRIINLNAELIGLSKGLTVDDISTNRQIAELAHFSGAIKHLLRAEKELRYGYMAVKADHRDSEN